METEEKKVEFPSDLHRHRVPMTYSSVLGSRWENIIAESVVWADRINNTEKDRYLAPSLQLLGSSVTKKRNASEKHVYPHATVTYYLNGSLHPSLNPAGLLLGYKGVYFPTYKNGIPKWKEEQYKIIEAMPYTERGCTTFLREEVYSYFSLGMKYSFAGHRIDYTNMRNAYEVFTFGIKYLNVSMDTLRHRVYELFLINLLNVVGNLFGYKVEYVHEMKPIKEGNIFSENDQKVLEDIIGIITNEKLFVLKINNIENLNPERNKLYLKSPVFVMARKGLWGDRDDGPWIEQMRAAMSKTMRRHAYFADRHGVQKWYIASPLFPLLITSCYHNAFYEMHSFLYTAMLMEKKKAQMKQQQEENEQYTNKVVNDMIMQTW